MTVTHTDTDDTPRILVTAPEVPTGWVAGLGTAFGLGALVSSSCCAIPMALAGLGAGGAIFSGMEFLAEWRLYFLGAACWALLTAWVTYFRRRTVACRTSSGCSPAAPTKRMAAILTIGTVFVALALAWDAVIEPVAVKLVR
ncbi:MAG TPA: hypothetical protein VKT76_02550 [Bradyrhizobium sp.]|nr:hypothetical protein [Bradyrhizobium sp.]